MVVKVVEGFYSESEIHQAKETIWRECGPLLTHTKSRRRGSIRYAAYFPAVPSPGNLTSYCFIVCLTNPKEENL